MATEMTKPRCIVDGCDGQPRASYCVHFGTGVEQFPPRPIGVSIYPGFGYGDPLCRVHALERHGWCIAVFKQTHPADMEV